MAKGKSDTYIEKDKWGAGDPKVNPWVRLFDVVVREASWQIVATYRRDDVAARALWASVPRHLAVFAAQLRLAERGRPFIVLADAQQAGHEAAR
jgi:hypothetical protein